jgi:hypothetical protein
MTDPTERDRLAHAGRRTALEHFAWSATLAAMDRPLEGLIGASEVSSAGIDCERDMKTEWRAAQHVAEGGRAAAAVVPY